ncbi:MAG: pirin family protein [Mariprofundaceae bacterium]
MMIEIKKSITVPEGEGLTVKRLMPVPQLRHFDPFVLWDHFDISGGGFPDHPHRGFEAITYMFSGGMQHADNLGNQGTIHAGGAQRFTAGRGIVHSEMPARSKDSCHAAGIQLWINLPKRLKGLDPDYQQVEKKDVPEEAIEGGVVRTIVGKIGAVHLHTEVEYLDVSLNEGAKFTRDIVKAMRGFVYVVEGTISIDHEIMAAGEAAYISEVDSLLIQASEKSRFMWCFGCPHGEPIHQHGSFVD